MKSRPTQHGSGLFCGVPFFSCQKTIFLLKFYFFSLFSFKLELCNHKIILMRRNLCRSPNPFPLETGLTSELDQVAEGLVQSACESKAVTSSFAGHFVEGFEHFLCKVHMQCYSCFSLPV